MKTITLEAWIIYGEDDSNDWTVFADVTDEEYALLEKLRAESDVVEADAVWKANAELWQKLIDLVHEDAADSRDEDEDEDEDEDSEAGDLDEDEDEDEDEPDYSCTFYYKG